MNFGILKALLILILANLTFGLKVMLIGGNLSMDQTSQDDIFEALAANTKKTRYNCGIDISKTHCPIVAVLTSAAHNQNQGISVFNVDDEQGLGYKSLFTKFGMLPVQVLNHIDTYKIGSNSSTPIGKANLDIINKADIIFFNGGDQIYHARSWLNDNGTYNNMMKVIVQRAKKNQVILAGTSAGTMIMPKMTYGEGNSSGMWYFHNYMGLAKKSVSDGEVNGTALLDERNGTNCFQQMQNGGTTFGFNLVNFQSDSHVNTRARVARLVPNLVQLRMPIGVAVDQNTAFLSIDSQIGYVYGKNGVTIVDISRAKVQASQFFQISNVTLSYLTAKDTYNFKTNEVTSSKPQIKSPRYSTFTDSNDIMAPNQISLLITRVVDQKPTYNIGKFKIPANYPPDTPKFQMRFSRNANSKGYYDNQTRSQRAKKMVFQTDYSPEQEQSRNIMLENSRYTVSNITLQMTYT